MRPSLTFSISLIIAANLHIRDRAVISHARAYAGYTPFASLVGASQHARQSGVVYPTQCCGGATNG